MDVSIIIVNYNTRDLTLNCIDSIVDKTTGIEFEIILVDNASTDGSYELFTQDGRIKYIYSQENFGFGKANNLGIKESQGKYLFFLNSDTILLNNAVKYFFDFCENSNEKIGALGAILIDQNQNNIHSYGRFITPAYEIWDVICKYLRFLKKRKFINPPSVTQTTAVDYITGADLFVPRSVYDELGGFDPAFFMYCEEVDWQFRMAKASYKRLIIVDPRIIHLEGGSDPSATRLWSFNRCYNLLKSRKQYLRKHYNGFFLPFYRFIYAMLWLPILFFVRKDTTDQKKSLLKYLFSLNK